MTRRIFRSDSCGVGGGSAVGMVGGLWFPSNPGYAIRRPRSFLSYDRSWVTMVTTWYTTRTWTIGRGGRSRRYVERELRIRVFEGTRTWVAFEGGFEGKMICGRGGGDVIESVKGRSKKFARKCETTVCVCVCVCVWNSFWTNIKPKTNLSSCSPPTGPKSRL